MKWGLLFLALLLLIFSSLGWLNWVEAIFQGRVAQVEGISYHIFQGLPFVSESARVKKLEKENLDLRAQIFSTDRLQKENAALLDQFQTTKPKSNILLPSRVLGAPGFVPGVSAPSYFILDKGSTDGVKKGQTVLVKDNFVGQIVEVSANNSKADLIYNPLLSFTAKTQSGAFGVIKGDGSEMTLDNVLLSDRIEENDLVYTKGDVNSLGNGILPDLIVGRIISLEKNPSALFQKAKIKAQVILNNLSTVFIVTGEK